MVTPILGIDVSKKELSLALSFEGSLKRRKVSNDPKGFKDLRDWLSKQGITCVKAYLEATGRYGEDVADYLHEQGHLVHIINPVCIKAFAKSIKSPQNG